MFRRRRSRGLTLLEVLIVIGILACVVAMLLPFVQSARESARRIACKDNMKELGFALHAYYDVHKQLPPSSGVTRDVKGVITAVDGWSWLVMIRPYWKIAALDKDQYERLDISDGRPLVEPAGTKGTPHADALATSFPELLCPSYRGDAYTESAAGKAAITNYRAMGATHIESLSVASPNPRTPKYGVGSLDGENVK